MRLLTPLLAVGLLLLSACDLGGSSNTETQSQLQFVARTAGVESADTTVVVEGDTVVIGPAELTEDSTEVHPKVEGQQGRISVRDGFFSTGSTGDRIEGDLDQGENRITLTVKVTQHGTVDVPGAYRYDAWATDLEAGSYRLIVRHGNEGDSEIVFDEKVQVK